MHARMLSRMLATGLGLSINCCAIAAGPVNEAQWDGPSIRSGFHLSIADAGCVFAGLGASNSWNAVPADFAIVTDVFYSHPRVSEQTQDFNYANITIEDAASLSGPYALMEARTLVAPGGGTIINSDIYVLRARLDPASANGGFSCSLSDNVPQDEYDFESALLHELGHSLGFHLTSEYQDDPSCAMYYGLQIGENRRELCDAERQEYIDSYGASADAN